MFNSYVVYPLRLFMLTWSLHLCMVNFISNASCYFRKNHGMFLQLKRSQRKK